jgi:hypothetical protein
MFYLKALRLYIIKIMLDNKKLIINKYLKSNIICKIIIKKDKILNIKFILKTK